MIVKRCDICGSHEGTFNLDDNLKKQKVMFTEKMLKISIKNSHGEDYNIYCEIYAEKATDSVAIANAEKSLKTVTMNTDIKQLFEAAQVKIDNPYPCICDQCKVEMLKKLNYILSEQ